VLITATHEQQKTQALVALRLSQTEAIRSSSGQHHRKALGELVHLRADTLKDMAGRQVQSTPDPSRRPAQYVSGSALCGIRSALACIALCIARTTLVGSPALQPPASGAAPAVLSLQPQRRRPLQSRVPFFVPVTSPHTQTHVHTHDPIQQRSSPTAIV